MRYGAGGVIKGGNSGKFRLGNSWQEIQGEITTVQRRQLPLVGIVVRLQAAQSSGRELQPGKPASPRYRPSPECNYAFGFDVSPPVESRDGELPFHSD